MFGFGQRANLIWAAIWAVFKPDLGDDLGGA
jgi:hypothetical protein